jgi:hypothetical protein
VSTQLQLKINNNNNNNNNNNKDAFPWTKIKETTEIIGPNIRY